jgi:hypothetical protein
MNYDVPPVFFNTPLEPLIPYDQSPTPITTSSGEASPVACPSTDANLTQAWSALSKFCAAINRAAREKHRLSKELLFSTMAAAMYRLVRARCVSIVDEAVRLGMLAFSSHRFLRMRGMWRSHWQ